MIESTGVDALSEVLNLLRLKSAVYFQADFPQGWGMEIPQATVSQFHMIVDGACELEYGGETVALRKGDILVFPNGQSHGLKGARGNEMVPGARVVEAIGQGNLPFLKDEPQTRIICGHYEIDQHVRHPLFDDLPVLIHLRKEEQDEWLVNMAQAIIQETAINQPGAKLIIRRLAEVLLVYVLRNYTMNQRDSNGFAAAIFHPQIGLGLAAIHKNPDKDWTLSKLAMESGMSRTAFANRFRDLTAITPMQYLTDLRMILASQMLVRENASLLEVAERVGYGSEAAFIRSFKRKFGKTPAKYRRSA